MTFEPGNSLGKKPESELSQHPGAVRIRERREAAKAQEQNVRAATAAEKRRQRAELVAKYGEDLVQARELKDELGYRVLSLHNFFGDPLGKFGSPLALALLKEGDRKIEILEEYIDAVAEMDEFLDENGFWTNPDPFLANTEWERASGKCGRLGMAWPAPGHVREFFSIGLRQYRAGERRIAPPEICLGYQKPAPPPAAAPAPVAPPPKVAEAATYETSPPEPRATLPSELHDALTKCWAALENRSGSSAH